MTNAALLIDGLIIVAYFIAITAIGLYMGRKEDTLEDYALGGRRVPWWAVMASIIAAETSAATFIGVPTEGYTRRGLMYVQLTLGLILGRVLVGYIFLQPYYEYRVYTVYDFLAVRFGSMSKNYVSGLFLVMRTLGSGVRLYVPSLVLVLAWRLFVQRQEVQYRELDSWVPYAWAIVILTIVTCIYTALGGIKAVIWTDVIQATLMFSSALVAMGAILYQLGGGSIMQGFSVLAAHVPEMTTRKGYIHTGFENLQPGSSTWAMVQAVLADPYTIIAALIPTAVGNMAAFGTDQDMVQRMLTAKDAKRSRRSLVTAALMDVPIASAFAFIGVLLIAFYALNPQLRPEKANDAFGTYILKVMPVVVRGFVLAGVFATAMGSLSAALNALATTLTNDWYLPYFGRGRSDRHQVTMARIFTALFAVLMILVAAFAAYMNVRNPKMGIIPMALGVAGFVLGPMLGVFLVGMLTRTRGSDGGNIIAVTIGLTMIFFTSGLHVTVANLFVEPGYRYVLPSWMPAIPFTWYAMIGAVTTFAVGLLFRTPEAAIEAAARKRKPDEAC
ncbi:MAG: sodium:proline symporter [Planctomycetes bacterium]|nr:sodium:proline symporter [Planctomycetota bacterium]